MKKMDTIVRSVVKLVSPLILASTVVFALYLAVFPALSPYLSIVELLLSPTEHVTDEGFDHVFEGYEGEENDVIDGNDIQFPARGALYARLAIESCSMEADVYFDDSTEALSRGGVGQHYGTKIPGYGTPILIGGHNNGKFNALQYVSVGDIVTITTNYGVYQYQIRETAIKDVDDPTAIDLSQDKEELILYTCYPFTTLRLTRQRFFVYADKISGPVVLH